MTGPPSAALAEIGLTDADFISLIGKIRNKEAVGERERVKWFKALSLTEPPGLPTDPTAWQFTAEFVDLGEVSSYVHEEGGADDKHTALPYADQVEALLNSDDERLWQSTFPFRVKGDAALRRLRLRDLPVLYADKNQLRSTLLRLEGCRSYKFVNNMCQAELVTEGYSYTEWFHVRGGLANIPTFAAFAKRVTTALKSTVFPDAYCMLVEASGMPGYRLLPDPEFDIVDRTRDAAIGLGLVHSTSDGLAAPWGWLNCISSLRLVHNHDYSTRRGLLSFEEFVGTPSLWSTSGSSSYGRLSYTDGVGKAKQTKARKLMLQYVTDAETLISRCKKLHVVEAVSLVKSELAKIRVAVASELEFYLVWAYLTYLIGDVASQWPGVTLGESTTQEMTRLYDMVNACSDSWGFPADFKEFDSQPLDDELLFICISMVVCAQSVADLPSWLITQALVGCLASRLSTPVSSTGHVTTFNTKNHLSSGVEYTSKTGNGFNSLASTSQIKLVEAWTLSAARDWLVNLALRGDDSSFLTTHIGYCLLLSLAARMMNYLHAPNKVSVLAQATELLRVSISKEHGCRGYPARVIPTLTERKPWSNEPWGAEDVIRTWWSTCCTLDRRGVKGSYLWSRLVLVWQRKRQLPLSCLSASPVDGGLGLGPPDDIFVTVNPGMGFTPHPSVQVKTGPWATELKKALFSEKGIRLSTAIADKMVQDDAVGTLSTVDLPEAARLNQQDYKLYLGSIQVMPRHVFGLTPAFSHYLEMVCQRFGSVACPVGMEEICYAYTPTLLGKFYNEQHTLTLNRALSRYSDEQIPHSLSFNQAVASMMRRFRTRRSVCEDWLTGTSVPMNFGTLHPTMQDRATKIASYLVEESVRFAAVYHLGLGCVSRLVSWRIGRAFADSPLHKKLYRW